jgi:hypothetical protein
MKPYDPLTELAAAAEQVLWKMNHNCADHRTGTIIPSPIDRRDATAQMLRKALER